MRDDMNQVKFGLYGLSQKSKSASITIITPFEIIRSEEFCEEIIKLDGEVKEISETFSFMPKFSWNSTVHHRAVVNIEHAASSLAAALRAHRRQSHVPHRH